MDFQGDFTMGFLGIFPEIHPLTAPKKCRAKARYRRTGNPAPDSWRYIASKGASGFKTQVLINTKARCRTGPSRNSRLNWSLTYIFIISSSSCSRVVAAVLLRANPPVRPHNFLGILKEYKVRPPLTLHSIGKINKGIRDINSHPRWTLHSIGKINMGIRNIISLPC